MTDDDIRHADDDEEAAEEMTALVGTTLSGLAVSVRGNDLCPQCVLLEMLVQVAGAAIAAGVTPGNIVSAVGEGLSMLEDHEENTGSGHLH